MRVYEEISFCDLLEKCWSGAIDTLRVIEENGKENEFMQLLEELYFEDTPSLTSINDLLRFDGDYIFEMLEIERG